MSKFYDNSFFKNLEDFDIVCLLETFIDTDVLPNDLSPSFIRYFSPALKLSTYGRCSGGAVVFVKKSLKGFCEIIKDDFDNIIALKLRNTCVDRNRDIIFVSAYIPPYSPPYYNTVEYDNGIHMLEQCITELQTKHLQCSFILCGDLNARTSCSQPLMECVTASKYVENLNSSFFFYGTQGFYSRRSKDNVVNGYGRSLLEMCAGFEFMILNGMCSSDPKGSFTFVSSHGNSIIDYFIISADLLHNNIGMSVQSRIESWHMSVTLSLNILNNAVKSAPMSEISIERFVCSNEKANEFIEKMNSEEVKNNVNFLQENVYLDTEPCHVSL